MTYKKIERELDLTRIIAYIAVFFYIIYNLFYGWNPEPINQIEEAFDSIALVLFCIPVILYFRAFFYFMKFYRINNGIEFIELSNLKYQKQMSKKQSISQTIKSLLTAYPHLRDDDNELVCSYWWIDLKKLNIDPKQISGDHLLNLISQKKLTNSSSILRERRFLQENFKELRGKKWLKNQGKEIKVAHDLVNRKKDLI